MLLVFFVVGGTIQQNSSCRKGLLMSDRVVDPNDNEYNGADPVIMALAKATLDEAADKLVEGEAVVPFTALAVKENLFIETHEYDNAADAYAAARAEVQGARGATGYAFCYDGELDTNKGKVNCLIAECGLPGEGFGIAFGYLYDDQGIYRDEITYIGKCPNFMERLKEELEVETELDKTTGEVRVQGMFNADDAVARMEKALADAEVKEDEGLQA